MQSKILNNVSNNRFSLIAEIGVNYYDIAKKYSITPMQAAKMMIIEAKKSGIHAVKFQSYKAETLASKNSPSYWDTTEETTKSQYDLFKKFDSFGFAEYKEIKEFCDLIDIEFLSTAFDTVSADYLDELMNVYKISSSDLNNHPFVEYQAKKNKPILLSVGASDLSEIEQTIKHIRLFNNNTIVLLHCVLEYPTPFDHANLNRIITLKKHFNNLVIGYSDHTKPDTNLDVLKTAYNLGALVIEKHFTLDKSLPGNDHYHAIDQFDAQKIISEISFIEKIRGSYEVKSLDSEKSARLNARRSLVAKSFIAKGTIITPDLITYKRPGTGISPSEMHLIIGKKATIDISEDTVLSLNMISDDEGGF